MIFIQFFRWSTYLLLLKRYRNAILCTAISKWTRRRGKRWARKKHKKIRNGWKLCYGFVIWVISVNVECVELTSEPNLVCRYSIFDKKAKKSEIRGTIWCIWMYAVHNVFCVSVLTSYTWLNRFYSACYTQTM